MTKAEQAAVIERTEGLFAQYLDDIGCGDTEDTEVAQTLLAAVRHAFVSGYRYGHWDGGSRVRNLIVGDD